MKKIRYGIIGVLGLFFYSILLASGIRNIYLSEDEGRGRFGVLQQPLKLMAEIPSLIKTVLDKPEFYVANQAAEDGLTFPGGTAVQGYPSLLVSYKEKRFGQEFELLDLNSGKTLKKWSPDNQALFEQAYNEANPRKPAKGSDLYFMHPLMTPDSSLLFTAQLTSLLAKIDAKGELLWLKNDRIYHHTLEADDTGRLYACTQPFLSGAYDILPDDYETYKNVLQDDHITILDMADGKELFSKSVIEILMENGYGELLLYKGQFISDPIHLNDVQPAPEDGAFWQKGDLLVSCRNLSAVFLYRPAANKILWLQHGPWLNQHDVDFYQGDKIVVFGNDVIREESTVDPRFINSDLYFPKRKTHNEVYVYSFAKDSVSTPYSALLQKENIGTFTSGRCDILENGEVFLEDTNHGRIVIGDSVRKKMEYVKRLDTDHISSMFWSRIVN